jgi:sigma-B regulation protein RsbU (phosphoserine phosphatase)
MSTQIDLTRHDIIVLLVDDQPIVGETVRRMLAPEADIVFHYCPDPARAVAMAAEISPTVILQDLVMPEIDGLTLVRFYRKHPQLKDVPLIVLSTKEEATTKAEAFAQGANDYLVKLPDRIELVARIRYHSRGYINLLERNEAYAKLLKSQQELASELARAADYVVSLLPKPVDTRPVLTQWRYVPSAQLGGDSFGHHWIDDAHFAIYLLDVCGHGVGSALLSVSALDTLRSQALPSLDFRDPSAVLTGMNEAFQMQKHNNLFFTLWYGVYDQSSRQLTFASGGHPPPIFFSPAGEVTRLSAANVIIGAFPRMKYNSESVSVPPGSKMYVFSDGVYEVDAPGGEMLSLDDLETFLKSPPPGEGSEMDRLYAWLQEVHGAPVLDDDFSLLRVTFT